jgi:biopolymer transport protein ExbD
MKMKSGQKVHYDAGPNMTPLVDIVMVILIFLMLTGTFATGEHFLQTNLPIAKTGMGTPDKNQVVPDDVTLNLRVDGYKALGQVDDSWTVTVGNKQITNNLPQLTADLVKMRENFNNAQTPTDKIQVYIEPGENTKYKFLINAYEAALDAQFTKVAFKPAHK